MERVTAALTDAFRIERLRGSGSDGSKRLSGRDPAAHELAGGDRHVLRWPALVKRSDAAPRSESARATSSNAGSRALKLDSPLIGAGALIGCDVAGWLLISTLVRLIAAHPDPMVAVTIFWIGQFCWGVALALYFGRWKMVRARGVVIFILGTSAMLTVGILGIAFLWSGGF